MFMFASSVSFISMIALLYFKSAILFKMERSAATLRNGTGPASSHLFNQRLLKQHVKNYLK